MLPFYVMTSFSAECTLCHFVMFDVMTADVMISIYVRCTVMWHWWHDFNLCQVCSTVCQVTMHDVMTVCHDVKRCSGCSLSCDNSLCHDIKLWQECSVLYYVSSHDRLCHDGSVLYVMWHLMTWHQCCQVYQVRTVMWWTFDGMTADITSANETKCDVCHDVILCQVCYEVMFWHHDTSR